MPYSNSQQSSFYLLSLLYQMRQIYLEKLYDVKMLCWDMNICEISRVAQLLVEALCQAFTSSKFTEIFIINLEHVYFIVDKAKL